MKTFLLVYFVVMLFLLFAFGVAQILFDEHVEGCTPKDVVASIVVWPLTLLLLIVVTLAVLFECFFGNTPSKSNPNV